MKTMEIIDPKKLAAAMNAAGFTKVRLAAEMRELAKRKVSWSAQSVGDWVAGKYSPRPDAVPYIQVALSVDFSEIASPVEWPEDLPKPKKMKKGD